MAENTKEIHLPKQEVTNEINEDLHLAAKEQIKAFFAELAVSTKKHNIAYQNGFYVLLDAPITEVLEKRGAKCRGHLAVACDGSVEQVVWVPLPGEEKKVQPLERKEMRISTKN